MISTTDVAVVPSRLLLSLSLSALFGNVLTAPLEVCTDGLFVPVPFPAEVTCSHGLPRFKGPE